MRILRAHFLVSTILLLTFLAIVFAQKPNNGPSLQRRLALEIGLNTPMTVRAGTEGHTLKAFWRIPANANSESPYSAIRLEPKLVGNNVEVTLTLLSGDINLVKSCKDWGLLKQSRVMTYNLNEGQEVTVSELSNLGSNFKDGKLTFRAVSILVPQDGQQRSEPCCASCGGSTCCPGTGHCLSCNGCGELCC